MLQEYVCREDYCEEKEDTVCFRDIYEVRGSLSRIQVSLISAGEGDRCKERGRCEMGSVLRKGCMVKRNVNEE